MGKIKGAIVAKSGRRYIVRVVDGEIWIKSQGEVQWYYVCGLEGGADPLEMAKGFVDSQDPAF